MLKHLPEGLVPFEDCGFARHPYAPLAGEEVVADCRVDQGDGEPSLLLSVDGAPERPVAGRWLDSRHMRFALGAFALGARVRYRFLTAGVRQSAFLPFRRRRSASFPGQRPFCGMAALCTRYLKALPSPLRGGMAP